MSEVEFLSPAAPVAMADEWFEIATANHFWMQWRHEVLLYHLKRTSRPIVRALEIGCGHGVARHMIERDLDIPVDGCDLNLSALQLAKKGKGQLYVYDIFDRNPSLLKRYDLLILMDVIEHLDDDRAFLKASLEHLKPEGLVAINVPAYMAFYSQYDTVAGHKRRYNRARIEWLFRETKVKPLAIVPWGFSLVPLLFARKFVLRFVSTERTIQSGFAEPNPTLGALLRMLKRVETHMPFRMPFGTSFLAWGRLRAVPDA